MLLSFFSVLFATFFIFLYVCASCLLAKGHISLSNFFQMSFKEALFEIQKKDMIPLRRVEIKNELENVPYRYPIKERVSYTLVYLFPFFH